MPRSTALRVEFSKEHDLYLYKYLARYCPSKEGRSGRKVFQCLIANEDKEWPWSVHHTWQSWRERYVKNAAHFDALILQYQRKHNIKSTERSKRAAEPMPMEMLGPSAKRLKLHAEQRVPSSETRTEKGVIAQPTSSSSSTSNLVSENPREPQPPDVRPSSPPCSNNGTNTDVTKKPSHDLPALQMRHDVLEIPSSSPNQQAPPPMDGEPEPRNPQRAVKRKERPRAPSEVFASEPSSPRRDPAAVDVGGAPVIDTVYPRAPPRVVDSLHGQVLVDRKGHVPCALPRGEENGAEEEEEEEEEEEVEVEVEVEDKTRWPPPRGSTAKQRTASAPDVEIDAHHAFSQPQPDPRPEASLESVAMGEREQGQRKPHHPFQHVPRPPDGALLDRRTVAALFSAGLRYGMAPQVESERREDMIQNGASPVKRIVPSAQTAPVSPSGPIPKPASKPLKFPAPRASTRSPFRPEPPAGKTRHPAPRPQSRTKAARHPALSRIRRQIIGHEHRNANGNGREHERGREHGQVPSVDLVALSHSSTSARSHSSSSAGPSVPTRPSRWSLPAFAHPTPWVVDEPEGAPSAPGSALGSGSGSPFRWVASSPMYADIWRHARTSSLGEISPPRFVFTPSPAHSITAVATNTSTDASAPHPNPIPVSVAPHPPDVPLTASHGLASILAHMSANHGLALGVVEAVYTRVGCLREADDVLRGMREAAEEFGKREIKRRARGQHEERRGSGVGRAEREEERQEGGDGDGKEQKRTMLRYVVTSEDGEGSEYSPPETSRAAMWKRQSESASYVEEGVEGEGDVREEDGDDEDELEGRAVEEELREEGEGEEGEGENENENGLPDRHHDFSQLLLENTEAQELERKMGRRQFHRDIVRRFV